MACNENDVVDFSRVIVLNPSAAFLIKEVGHSDFDTDRLTQLLMDRFNLEPERAQSDAMKLTDQLTQAKLLDNVAN
jgi:hypothetical protein